MRASLSAGLAIAFLSGSCLPLSAAQPCVSFEDDELIELQGTVVQSATTEEAEGVPPHKYMALLLDKQICFAKDVEQEINFLETYPVADKWLGHYVTIKGNMIAGDGWSIKVTEIQDASVHIRDQEEETDHPKSIPPEVAQNLQFQQELMAAYKTFYKSGDKSLPCLLGMQHDEDAISRCHIPNEQLPAAVEFMGKNFAGMAWGQSHCVPAVPSGYTCTDHGYSIRFSR